MICQEEDEFVRDRLRWVVQLNNGIIVYGDDDRPGVDPPSAWKRLKLYCHEYNLYITKMWFQFRSHRVEVGIPDAPGYYFCKSVSALFGQTGVYHGYIGGHLLSDGRVDATHWRTPELVPLERSLRKVPPEHADCLIARPT